MIRGGFFDYINVSGTIQAERLKGYMIQPRTTTAELETRVSFQEKFDLVVRYLLGQEAVSIEEIIEELGIEKETAEFLRREVDSVRNGQRDLADFIDDMTRDDDGSLEEASLAAVGDFWTRYQVIQRIATVVNSWEMRYDKASLSQKGLRELQDQLIRDFSDATGLIRAIYDNLIPRIERLIKAVEE